ncbi:MAG: HemX protein [Candidatus Krumholzibacteriia bacterium]|jgi:HemX protein
MELLHTLHMNLMTPVYLIVWACYMRLFITDSLFAHKWSTRFALAAVVLDTAAMVHLGLELKRLPMGGTLEFLGLLALALLVTYLLIEMRQVNKHTGFLITGMAFVCKLLADLLTSPVPEVNPYLSDPGFAGHALFILIAYTALSLSFLYAVLYLILARQLNRRRFGLLFRRLPSLDGLERMSIGAVEIGAPMLFVGLSLGHLWMYNLAHILAPELATSLSPYDPKILVSWIVFAAFAVILVGYRFLDWRGRRMVTLTAIAYLCLVLAMGLLNHYAPSFHKFQPTTIVEPSGGGS